MNNLKVSARDAYLQLGYARWENFNNLVKRAQNLINNGEYKGEITQTVKNVNTGKGAVRPLIDYLFDEYAFALIEKLANSYKINSYYSIRNETTILSLLKKYCAYKGIDFEFQYRTGGYVFDCLIESSCLIEFDEPHHKRSRQSRKDILKDEYALKNGYKLFRFNIEHDIIDILSALKL